MDSSSKIERSRRLHNSFSLESFYSAPRVANALLFLAVTAFIGAWAVAGQAMPACTDHADLREGLKQAHGEQPIGGGIEARGGLLEIYSAPDGKSWTLVVTGANKRSCIVATGEHWRVFKVVEPGEPS